LQIAVQTVSESRDGPRSSLSLGLYIIDVNSVPIIQERPLPCCFRKLLLVTIPVQ